MSGMSDGVSDRFLIVDYQWLPTIEGSLRVRLEEFADAASRYDTEAGFSQISDFRRGVTAESGSGAPESPMRYLVAYASKEDGTRLERNGEREIVAYMSIRADAGEATGSATLVVAPEFRSRGIATLLVEKLRVESPSVDDWFGTGLQELVFEAAGPHPAAERLAARIRVPVDDVRWMLVRDLRGSRAPLELLAEAGSIVMIECQESPDSPALHGESTSRMLLDSQQIRDAATIIRRSYRSTDSDGDTHIVVRLSADVQERIAKIAYLEFVGDLSDLSDEIADALIDVILRDLSALGVKGVLASVDPQMDAVVRACRRNFFQHDQSNLTFSVRLDK